MIDIEKIRQYQLLNDIISQVSSMGDGAFTKAKDFYGPDFRDGKVAMDYVLKPETHFSPPMSKTEQRAALRSLFHEGAGPVHIGILIYSSQEDLYPDLERYDIVFDVNTLRSLRDRLLTEVGADLPKLVKDRSDAREQIEQASVEGYRPEVNQFASLRIDGNGYVRCGVHNLHELLQQQKHELLKYMIRNPGLHRWTHYYRVLFPEGNINLAQKTTLQKYLNAVKKAVGDYCPDAVVASKKAYIEEEGSMEQIYGLEGKR